jgi:hypothetical protein
MEFPTMEPQPNALKGARPDSYPGWSKNRAFLYVGPILKGWNGICYRPSDHKNDPTINRANHYLSLNLGAVCEVSKRNEHPD